MEKRSVIIGGGKTSIAMEEIFFVELKRIARLHGTSLQEYIGGIDGRRRGKNLSSALRQHVLAYILAERDAALDRIEK